MALSVQQHMDLAVQQLSDRQLDKFAKLIYDAVGVQITPQKRAMLSNRLRRRLKDNDLSCFDAYYEKLVRLSKTDAEWDQFLQAVTTHETFLFRDQAQWDWFQNEFLTERFRDSTAASQRRLRIWSAASSTGDEAFTIATCIGGKLPSLGSWKIEIVGTDIGIEAVRSAQAATFGERAMRLVPENLRKRFFTADAGTEQWTANATLKAMTRFERHNLLSPYRADPFDVVFLKNVMIYFDTPTKAQVLRNVTGAMRKGSLLVTGASEAVSSLLTGFRRVKPWLFEFQG